jgi:hypothetical protein
MKSELEKFIDNNSEYLDERLPDPAVLGRILQQMEVKAQTQQRKGILIPFRTLQWAAAALVLLACGIAVYTIKPPATERVYATGTPTRKTITRLEKDTAEELNPKQVAATILPEQNNRDAVDREIAQQKRKLLAKLTNNTLESRKLLMLASLKDMDSPARRITAVAQSGELKMVGHDVTVALINTLNNDPNTNVRLAALDGLARFYRENYIRKQLIVSLKTQKNPTIQIALIELLTRMKEVAVLAELDKIVTNDSTMNAVKDCAYSGIFKLRKS